MAYHGDTVNSIDVVSFRLSCLACSSRRKTASGPVQVVQPSERQRWITRGSFSIIIFATDLRLLFSLSGDFG